MKKKKALREYVKTETVVRYRNPKNGRFVKDGKKGGSEREVWKVLYMKDKKSGKISIAGTIRERKKRPLLDRKGKFENMMLKRELEDKGFLKRVSSLKSIRGLEIIIKAKGKRKKDVSFRTRIILSPGEMTPDLLERILVARVLRQIDKRGYRLSSLEVGAKNKKAYMLKGSRLIVNYFY